MRKLSFKLTNDSTETILSLAGNMLVNLSIGGFDANDSSSGFSVGGVHNAHGQRVIGRAG
jgi:hypothetical protein